MKAVLHVKVLGSHALVMGCSVMFCEIVCKICTSRSPKDMKLILVNVIAYLVETHVDSFGALLFDMIFCNPCCGGVIHLNGSGGLRVPLFFQCCS